MRRFLSYVITQSLLALLALRETFDDEANAPFLFVRLAKPLQVLLALLNNNLAADSHIA